MTHNYYKKFGDTDKTTHIMTKDHFSLHRYIFINLTLHLIYTKANNTLKISGKDKKHSILVC